jgi:hypothetical protein
VNSTFTLSSKLLELESNGFIISVDESYINRAEKLVSELSPEENDIVNPFGLLGNEKPSFHPLSPAEKRLAAKLIR